MALFDAERDGWPADAEGHGWTRGNLSEGGTLKCLEACSNLTIAANLPHLKEILIRYNMPDESGLGLIGFDAAAQGSWVVQLDGRAREIRLMRGPAENEIRAGKFPVPPTGTHDLRIERDARDVRVWLDTSQIIATDGNYSPSGPAMWVGGSRVELETLQILRSDAPTRT